MDPQDAIRAINAETPGDKIGPAGAMPLGRVVRKGGGALSTHRAAEV